MNILYISQYFPPEMGAPAARVSELSRHWAQSGHKVTVLTGFPNHPTGVVHADYRDRLWKLLYREHADGFTIQRTWLWPLPNRKSHERILNYSSFCLSSSVTGSFLKKPDVIIATSPQLLVGMSGWWLSKIKGLPLVMEIRDLWPESIIASGVGNQKSVLSHTLTAISDFLYRNSSHIVVVTPAFKRDIEEKYDIDPGKISIVENGVETDLFTPEGDQDIVKQDLALKEKFVVSIIGTFGLAHGLSTVLDAAEDLRDEYPNIVFMFVGEGADKGRLLDMARNRGLSNVLFKPQQPREEIPAYIRASDICLVLLKKAPVFKTVIPTKMLEFMSCRCPVILGVNGQARQLVEEARAGIYVEPENSDALRNAIIRLYNDAKPRDALGSNGRSYIVNRLSRKRTAETYIEVLRTVVADWKEKRDLN